MIEVPSFWRICFLEPPAKNRIGLGERRKQNPQARTELQQ